MGSAPAAQLVAVTVGAQPATSTASIGHAIAVDLAGAVVRVARGAGPAMLRTVIAALRGMPT